MVDKDTGQEQTHNNPPGKPYALHRQGKTRLYFVTFRAAVETMKGEPQYSCAISRSGPVSEGSQ